MCKDGVPYCEDDYQTLFGQSCNICSEYIIGKVSYEVQSTPQIPPLSGLAKNNSIAYITKKNIFEKISRGIRGKAVNRGAVLGGGL